MAAAVTPHRDELDGFCSVVADDPPWFCCI